MFSISVEMSEHLCLCRWSVSSSHSSVTTLPEPDAHLRRLLDIQSLNDLQATLLSPLLQSKLHFLFSRLPVVLSETAVTFSLTETAVEVSCADNIFYIYVDQTTGMFCLNHALVLGKS